MNMITQNKEDGSHDDWNSHLHYRNRFFCYRFYYDDSGDPAWPFKKKGHHGKDEMEILNYRIDSGSEN